MLVIKFIEVDNLLRPKGSVIGLSHIFRFHLCELLKTPPIWKFIERVGEIATI